MNLQTAVDLKLYELTVFECGQKVEQMIDTCPIRNFEELEAGKSYLHKQYKSESFEQAEIYHIEKIKPAGTQAVVRLYLKDRDKRQITIYKRQNSGVFHELSDVIMNLIGIDHGDIVDLAKNLDLEIPAKVKIEHPELFIEIPERFSREQVRDFLCPKWGHYPTAADCDACIAGCHKSWQQTAETRVLREIINPSLKPDYDKWQESNVNRIDFYRWIRPLVDEGGIFFVEQTKTIY